MSRHLESPESTLQHFRERASSILDMLDRLVRIESPSGDAGAVARFVGAYRRQLEDLGLRCEEQAGRNGPLLHGRLDVGRPSSPPLLIVGHADTVWPLGEVERRPPREKQGLYFGPGAHDMKAGLACVLFALQWLVRAGAPLSRGIEVIVSPDEETGSETAHPYMERDLPSDATALVLEPPLADGSMKAWRKGVGMYRLEVRGREAHAGNEPEAGVNAIVELADRVLEIVSWTDRRRGIAVNVGEVHGGIATNVVAGRAVAGVDTRFDDLDDGIAIDSRLRAIRPRDPRASISVSGGIIFPPLVPDERSRQLAQVAVDVASTVGLRIAAGRCGGGSDGSYMSSRGLAVLDGLGVEGGGAHSPDEHIVISMLPVRTAFLARLILALGS